jgi:hypothetical protein
LIKENINFPLTCFLVGAQRYSYIIYNCGYGIDSGCLDWYPDFDRSQGRPSGDMVKK